MSLRRKRASTTSSGLPASRAHSGLRRCGARSGPPSASSATLAAASSSTSSARPSTPRAWWATSGWSSTSLARYSRIASCRCSWRCLSLGATQSSGSTLPALAVAVFRLDRHPSMSRHPTTPMTEADLGRILEDQGAPACGLVDTLTYAGGVVATTKTIARERARVPGPIVFDGLHDDDCRLAAEAIWGTANGPESVVVLSSQGFAHGFGLFRMNRPAGRTPPIEALAAVEKLLVVSGSAAPLTARQIDLFARSGAATARLVASRTLDPARTSEAIAAAVDTASRALGAGRSVCVYTALGPEDEDRPLSGRLPPAGRSTPGRSPAASVKRWAKSSCGWSSATASLVW